MKLKKSHISNIITVAFIALLIIPQTRKPIQLGLNRVVALFGPSVSLGENAYVISDYNWQLMDEEGNEFNFESAEGKVVFINRWATWCMPCVAELPSMNKLYKDYSDKVVFLFVSTEKISRSKRFMKRKEYSLPVFRPLTESPEDIFSNTLPTTYVIGKNGMIHVDKAGAANWNSDGVRELLDELIAE